MQARPLNGDASEASAALQDEVFVWRKCLAEVAPAWTFPLKMFKIVDRK
jgi:hypothetical protein